MVFQQSPLTDGGRISGSTNSTLNIANVQTNDGGNYQLVASNIVGVTTSSVAVLTPIILPPSFPPAAREPVGAGRLECELLRRGGRHAALQLPVVFQRQSARG